MQRLADVQRAWLITAWMVLTLSPQSRVWSHDPPAPLMTPASREESQAAQSAWAKHLKLPAERENSLGMKLVLIPPGQFRMGSPESEPGRRETLEGAVDVTLTKAFYIGKYEVTQHEYDAVMGSNPSWFRKEGFGREQVQDLDTTHFPVENEDSLKAKAFCQKLTSRPAEQSHLQSGWEYRLPTEAQWEYACRAGSAAAFHWKEAASVNVANLGAYAKLPGALGRTTTVGSYPANAWELHDMHGNVNEWCADGLSPELPGGKDPFVAPLENFPPQAIAFAAKKHHFHRIYRGGCWVSATDECRAAHRNFASPNSAGSLFGLRVVCVQVDSSDK